MSRTRRLFPITFKRDAGEHPRIPDSWRDICRGPLVPEHLQDGIDVSNAGLDHPTLLIEANQIAA